MKRHQYFSGQEWPRAGSRLTEKEIVKQIQNWERYPESKAPPQPLLPLLLE